MGTKVLYVEDELFLGKIVKESLESRGFEVIMESDGGKATDAFKKSNPDICVLDIMLPNKDGFTIADEIRDLNESIPIIFLTAKTETADIVRGFELGAVDYVAKPFNAHELLARVNTHLTIDELRRDMAKKNVELARAHELVRRAFGRYVSEEVAANILKSPEGLELGGEEREVTILMSDLRGFTGANALIAFEAGDRSYAAGEIIQVLPL